METKDILAIFTTVLIFIAGVLSYNTGFVIDATIYLLLVLFVLKFYNEFNLDTTSFAFLCSAFILHNLGGFGLFDVKEAFLGLQLDAVIHFYTMFCFSILIFRMILPHLDKKLTAKNILFFGLVVLGTLGIGAIIELIEFVGKVWLGSGEGTFYWGMTEANHLMDTGAETFGVVYMDTMWDFIDDLLGAITGLIFSLVIKKARTSAPQHQSRLP